MDEAQLKTFLLDRDRGLMDVFSFVDEQLDALGSLDPELRDGLFYATVDGWIREGRLSPQELTLLARRLVSTEFLFKACGEVRGDDVFRRTFSALILDSIVRRFNALRMDDPSLHEFIASAMELYVEEERDLRGYVVPHGWAHAVAHAADVLASLAASSCLPGSWNPRLLGMVRTLLLKSGEVYTHQEDKRLARPVCALTEQRGLDPSSWIDALIEACPVSFSDPEMYARRTNLLDFLRALYFQLRLVPECEALTEFVELRIRTLMRIG